jgi:hypothetical protein
VAPAIEASWLELEIALPAKKAAPPLEVWIMMGDLASRAASRVAMTVEEDVTLTAGRAKPVCLA